MTTKANANIRVVTIIDLWYIFVHRLWVMALAAVVAVGGLFIINRVTFVPAYSSTATLYILRQNEATATGNSDSDFSLALKVVNDCDYLLKSHSILDEVIQERNLNTGEVMEFEVSGEKIEAVQMLPGWTHNIINLSETDNLVTVIWANELFDTNHPDTYFEVV